MLSRPGLRPEPHWKSLQRFLGTLELFAAGGLKRERNRKGRKGKKIGDTETPGQLCPQPLKLGIQHCQFVHELYINSIVLYTYLPRFCSYFS